MKNNVKNYEKDINYIKSYRNMRQHWQMRHLDKCLTNGKIQKLLTGI